MSPSEFRASSAFSSRIKIQTGFLRHKTRTSWPASSFEMSISIGAPAAFVFAEGFHVDKKGQATKPTPTAPTTLVALVKKRLFFKSIVCSDIKTLKDN